MAEDYYQILGVLRDTTNEETKKAYRRLAVKYHPDHNPGKEEWATEKFKEINEAYEVLGNPQKRKQYDLTGGGGDYRNIFYNAWTRSAFEDVIKDFYHGGLGFDIFNEIFGAEFQKFFGKPLYRKTRPVMIFGIPLQQDLDLKLIISLEEAEKGTKRILVINSRPFEISIPPKVKKGAKVVYRKARQKIDNQPGNLIVHIRIKDKAG